MAEPSKPIHTIADSTPKSESLGRLSRPDAPSRDSTEIIGDTGTFPKLPDYEIREEIGRGGMGVVYRAVQTKLKRVVALKMILADANISTSQKLRFLREAQATASIEHDNVIRVYDFGESNGQFYMAMELLRGESLHHRLKRQPLLPYAGVVRIGIQVAEGLAATHAQGLIHRDIKPENIWLERREVGAKVVQRVKLMDFGIVRDREDSGVTQSGGIVGTPEYMSPEQARGQEVHSTSDLFSLGTVLYQLATGRKPFTGNNIFTILKAIDSEEPTDPWQIRADIPQPLVEIILRLLSKDPAGRFGSAHEVAELLKAIDVKGSPNRSLSSSPALSDTRAATLTTKKVTWKKGRSVDLANEVWDELPTGTRTPLPSRVKRSWRQIGIFAGLPIAFGIMMFMIIRAATSSAEDQQVTIVTRVLPKPIARIDSGTERKKIDKVVPVPPKTDPNNSTVPELLSMMPRTVPVEVAKVELPVVEPKVVPPPMKTPPPKDEPNDAAWLHGLDLKCRRAAEKEFTDQTRVFGVESYKDEPTRSEIYINSEGAIAIADSERVPKKKREKSGPATYLHGIILKCRPGSTDNWDDAERFGLEVRHDENNGHFVYQTERGFMALLPGAKTKAKASTDKGGTWQAGMTTKCRTPGEAEFTKETRKFGTEIYRDDNNGNWVYICETGSIAATTSPKTLLGTDSDVKTPVDIGQMKLHSRYAADRTRRFNIEVFYYEYGGCLLFISNVGSIAVLPVTNGKPKWQPNIEPDWHHGLLLKCRDGKQTTFDDAKVFRVDAYRDKLNGVTVFISETGSIAVTRR